MSDSDDKKPLGIRGGSGKASNVRQSFGHGRTKSVVVETKRNRVVNPTPIPQKATENSSSAPQPPGLSKRPSGITDAEMTRRLTALKAAKEQEGVDKARREKEEKTRAEERAIRLAENTEKEREGREREGVCKEKGGKKSRVSLRLLFAEL